MVVDVETQPEQPVENGPDQDQGQDQLANAESQEASTQTAQPAPQAEPRTFTVRGRVMSEQDALALAEAGYLTHQEVAEFHKARQEAEELRAVLQDPRALLGKLPEEHRKQLVRLFAEDWKRSQEEAQLTPEQKRVRNLERELAKYKSSHEQTEQARIQAEEERALVDLKAQIATAMKATGLPTTPALARRIAQQMQLNARANVNYPPAIVARQVRDAWQQEQAQAYADMTPAQLFDVLPSLIDKLEGLDDEGVLARLDKLRERMHQRTLARLQQPAAPRLTVVPPQGQGGQRPANATEPSRRELLERHFGLKR